MSKKTTKSFKFKTDLGVEYSVNRNKITTKINAEGFCDSPDSKSPEIVIDPRLLPKREMSVTIEEFAHAFFWEKSEKKVRKFAAVLTKYLYTQGWRKIP